MSIREDFLRPRTDRENAARRAAILDAAEALIRENHHQRFSVNEVAKRVGVSQSTIFLHFRNREELVTTLYIRVGRAFFDAFLGRLHEGMSDTAFCEAFIDAAQEHPCFRLMRPMVMRVVEECLSHEFIHVAVADIVAFRSVASARVEEVLGLTPGQGPVLMKGFVNQMCGAVQVDIRTLMAADDMSEAVAAAIRASDFRSSFLSGAELLVKGIRHG
jgi:AcrR family transcriptional regulator